MIMYKQVKDITGAISNSQTFNIETNSYIPFDPANTDYQAYLKWVEEGNTPLPADE